MPFLTLAQLPLAQGLWLACGKNAKTYFVAVASVKLPHQGRFYHWIKIFYPVIQQYEITCVLIINMINWNMGKIIIVKINYLSVYNYRAVYNQAKNTSPEEKNCIWHTDEIWHTWYKCGAQSKQISQGRICVLCDVWVISLHFSRNWVLIIHTKSSFYRKLHALIPSGGFSPGFWEGPNVTQYSYFSLHCHRRSV